MKLDPYFLIFLSTELFSLFFTYSLGFPPSDGQNYEINNKYPNCSKYPETKFKTKIARSQSMPKVARNYLINRPFDPLLMIG